MTFRLADPDGRYAAVRLCSDLRLTDPQRTFARAGEEWVLQLEPPPIARLEYQLELVHPDGGTDIVLEPGNPHRAPGAFGEKSVLLMPGYTAPAWLDAEPAPGTFTELEPRGRGLRANVPARVWTPEQQAGALPLLVAHDGPEMDALAGLTRYAAAMIAAGELPPHRVALLSPGHRDEWYSGSALYARALATDVLPALDPIAPVGIGASLGGLAMLHAHATRTPFSAMFLQSGSFFVPRHDSQEKRFPRYRRVVRVVRELYRDAGPPVPATLTCGIAEENLANNRLMARALQAQGFETQFAEVPDMHNFTGWRDAFHPHLTRLLQQAWG
jgi:enterochelin esterase-like enzyme